MRALGVRSRIRAAALSPFFEIAGRHDDFGSGAGEPRRDLETDSVGGARDERKRSVRSGR
jgi:hypothetical protein